MLLRRVRRTRWDTPEWLSEGQAPVYPILDFFDDEDLAITRISLFRVGSSREFEERVLAALGSTRDSVAAVDYVLFPEGFLEEAGVPSEVTAGDTPDEEVNSEMHLDVGHLELLAVANLVTRVHVAWRDTDSSVELCRCKPGEMKALIRRFLDSGDLSETSVTPGVLKKVRP